MKLSPNTKQLLGFGVFLGAIHWLYYKIQHTDSMVQPHQRTELFYVKWLKDALPEGTFKERVKDFT
ncbi:Protein Y11D7A.10 d, partial [Aphelenchoides avenae]